MADTTEVTIVLEDDWPVLVIFFLVLALISIGVQILEYGRQRRKLVVAPGANQELRQRGRLFFYTALILGVLTLVVNYITGITASLAAAHIDEAQDAWSLLSLPGIGFTVLILATYVAAILVIAALFLKNERIELPELLADLHDARKFGALDTPRQVAHYTAELDALCLVRDGVPKRQGTSGEFLELFTSQESTARPGVREQLRHLRSAPGRRERMHHFHRRLFLDYRLAAGKWLLPLALLALLSLWFAVQESIAPEDGSTDTELVIFWVVSFILAVVAFAGQYRCELVKALLLSRKEFISGQTEAECRSILAEAAQDVADADAARRAAAAVVPAQQHARAAGDGDAGVLLRIGRLEVRRRPRDR